MAADVRRQRLRIVKRRIDDVIGISICDFELWPRDQHPRVPMLSRRRAAAQLDALDLAGLEALRARLRAKRHWPCWRWSSSWSPRDSRPSPATM